MYSNDKPFKMWDNFKAIEEIRPAANAGLSFKAAAGQKNIRLDGSPSTGAATYKWELVPRTRIIDPNAASEGNPGPTEIDPTQSLPRRTKPRWSRGPSPAMPGDKIPSAARHPWIPICPTITCVSTLKPFPAAAWTGGDGRRACACTPFFCVPASPIEMQPNMLDNQCAWAGWIHMGLRDGIVRRFLPGGIRDESIQPASIHETNGLPRQ